jgi:DNA-binding MarR family transcriptional regulator
MEIASPDLKRDLVILDQIEQNPKATQAFLAGKLGVAVGTINWHLKRLVEKGFIKVKHAERRKLLYIITPEGIALRARLTVDYIQTSFQLYRLVRERALIALETIQENGYSAVRIQGDGDVADICRLTCLEQSFQVVDGADVPVLVVDGLKIHPELINLT